MRAGPLRVRVLILAPAESRDAGGSVAAADTVVAEVYAAVEPLSSRERLIASAQTETRLSVRVRMRYFAGLTPAYTLRQLDDDAPGGMRTYRIVGVVNPDGRRIEHVCDCVEAA